MKRPQVPQHPYPVCLPSVLEVHQFAQEAVVADAWLTAQEPLLQSRELGSSVDEVEQLIRRHEAFRKAAAAWEERFSSLRRLTTVSTQICPIPSHPGPHPTPLYETDTLGLGSVLCWVRRRQTGLPVRAWGCRGLTCQSGAGMGKAQGLWEPRNTWPGLGESDLRLKE